MTETEYREELDSLAAAYERAARCIAGWKSFKSGKTKIRPTTRILFHFRPGDLLVKDTLLLLKKVAVPKSAGTMSKSRFKTIAGMIKGILGQLEPFITVPVVKGELNVESVRQLFDLTHQRLTEEMDERVGEDCLAVPVNSGDNRAYNKAMKMLAHRLSQVIINDPKVKDVCSFPQARDYIISCKRGDLYIKQCSALQDAMTSFRWKPQSLLTYCKGGGVTDKKTNDKRQIKISKKSRRVSRDLKGAWHDAVP